MIEIRIERLSEPEHRALEAASVSGALFSIVVGAAAANMDVESLKTCAKACRAGTTSCVRRILRNSRIDSASERYEFVHALYREVLYRRQSPGRRAKLHLLAGERLEALFAQRPGEAAAELAHHFEQVEIGCVLRSTSSLRQTPPGAGPRSTSGGDPSDPRQYVRRPGQLLSKLEIARRPGPRHCEVR